MLELVLVLGGFGLWYVVVLRGYRDLVNYQRLTRMLASKRLTIIPDALPIGVGVSFGSV